MPDFVKGPAYRTPFGTGVFLRSTVGLKFEHYTVAASTIPAETIDGVATKRLRKGQVMAKITSGGDVGKIGPYVGDATDGRQTLANIVGLNNTELPWQLNERDVEVAVVYECTAVQAWCSEYTTLAGGRVALTNTVADAMRSVKTMDITFH